MQLKGEEVTATATNLRVVTDLSKPLEDSYQPDTFTYYCWKVNSLTDEVDAGAGKGGIGAHVAGHPSFRMMQHIDLVLLAEKQVRVEGINMWFLCADKKLKDFYKKVAAF